MKKPIRILHVMATVNRGGAESRTMDLYRNIDREKVQFDFLLHTSKSCHYEAEISSLGGNIYRVPRFRMYNLFTYLMAMRAFFHEHREFSAVHGHITSTAALYLPIARKAGIPVTIAHGRSAGVDAGIKGRLTHFLRRNLYQKADFLFACSKLAAVAVFGQKAVDLGLTTYIPNTIEATRFKYNELTRMSIRKRLNIDNMFVIGHVGHFRHAKNHEYLLKVFYEVQKNLSDSRLILLGDGSGKERIQNAAKELGILNKIFFLGNVEQVWDYYQAMDYFVFPSRYEGMPGTVIEAQTSGLKCLISDAIAKEAFVTDLVTSRNIDENPKKWADFILTTRNYQRICRIDEIRNAGFDAQQQVDNITDFYLKPKPKLMLIAPMLHQGGFERVCVNTARLLAPYYDVVITLFDSANIAYDVEGLNIIDIKQGVKEGNFAKIINIIIRSFKMRKLKQLHQPIVAYSFGPSANIVNALSKTKRTKVWLSLRNYTDVDEKQMMGIFIKMADKIVSCSHEINKALKDKYQYMEAVTIHNPYNVAEMRKTAAAAEPELPWDEMDFNILVSMGREDDMKGFWHTIKVFYLVKKKYPETKLMIIGGGSFAEYKKLTADLGISDSVYFTGLQKEPYQYLKKGTIYLLNSLNEGFPNALVEAMTMGMAAVACDCRTGPAEILMERRTTEAERARFYQDKSAIWGKYGILVPVMDGKRNLNANIITEAEQNMAEIVISLLSEPELLNKYRKAAAKRAEDFSCDNYVGIFLKMLQEDGE